MTSPLPQTLMRAIDLRYPSNRYAVGAALGALLLSRLTDRTWPQAGRVGALAFLAWAVVREVDPDHPQSAGSALPLAGLLAWMDGERSVTQAALDLAGSGAVLAGLRFTTGSVGAVPEQSDFLALLGAAAISALSGQRGAALLVALAPLAVRLSRDEDFGGALPRGALALLPTIQAAKECSVLTRLIAAASLLTAAQMVQPEQVEAKTDRGTGKVSSERLRAARLLAVAGAILSAGEGRGSAAAVLAAANLAVGLRRMTA